MSSFSELNSLNEFKRRALPYLSNYIPSNDLEWLALAQHHGQATRLLDWTESLLVAAYFAVADAVQENDPVIYALPSAFHRLSEGQDSKFDVFDPKRTCVYRPPHVSPNIVAQQGIFTLSDQPVKPLDEDNAIMIRSWQITCNLLDIKDRLNLCDVNHASLFPGLDGVARHVSWLQKWGHLDLAPLIQ